MVLGFRGEYFRYSPKSGHISAASDPSASSHERTFWGSPDWCRNILHIQNSGFSRASVITLEADIGGKAEKQPLLAISGHSTVWPEPRKTVEISYTFVAGAFATCA